MDEIAPLVMECRQELASLQALIAKLDGCHRGFQASITGPAIAPASATAMLGLRQAAAALDLFISAQRATDTGPKAGAIAA